MNSVASHLGIGRATLYRWVGDREKQLGRVLLASISNLWQRSLADSEGEGLERPLDATRRFIEGCIENGPVTSFTHASRTSPCAFYSIPTASLPTYSSASF